MDKRLAVPDFEVNIAPRTFARAYPDPVTLRITSLWDEARNNQLLRSGDRGM